LTATLANSGQAAPFSLPVTTGAIPGELKTGRRFVLWRWVCRDGKWTKPPFQADGRAARVDTPSTWASFDSALAAYESGGFDGIGRVLAQGDGLAGADLDGCRDPETGEIEPWAQELIDMLPTCWEVSPSGRGVRAWVLGTLPPGSRRKGKVELYDQGRFLTLTGHPVEGTAALVEPCQDQLEQLHRHVFAAPEPRPAPASPSGPARLRVPDDELLDRARGSKNGGTFAQLFDQGDLSRHEGDHSAADLALCCTLAFWTNGDPVAVDRLFRRSALMREKWDRRHYADGRTYGQATVDRALDMVREGWRPSARLTVHGRAVGGQSPRPAGGGGEAGTPASARTTDDEVPLELRVMLTNPRTWYLTLPGLREIRLATSDLDLWRRIELACRDQLITEPTWRPRSKEHWQLVVGRLMQTVEIQQPPPEFTQTGRLRDLVRRFAGKSSPDKDALTKHKAYHDEEEGLLLFRINDFLVTVREAGEKDLTPPLVLEGLRELGGELRRVRVNGPQLRVMALPDSILADESEEGVAEDA
jgi:putative DNA primase/helicase